MIVTEQNMSEFVSWLSPQYDLAVDTETTGLNPYGIRNPDRICGVSIGGQDGRTFYLPFRHKSAGNLPLRYLEYLTGYLNERNLDGSLNLIFWNAKFDLHMLAVDGLNPRPHGGVEDAMIAAHLLNENEPSFGLKEYCDRYQLGPGSLDERELREAIEARYGRKKEKEWKGLIHAMPVEAVAPYAETDVVLTLAAANAQRPALKAWNLDRLYAEMNDYLLMIWRMERRGIRLDRDEVATQMRTLNPRKVDTLDAILDEVKRLTGSTLDPTPRPVVIGKRGLPLKQKPVYTFNPGSPSQVTVLTDWPKTDVRFIEELADDDPFKHFGELILDYRVLSKMSGTYYDAYLDMVDVEGTLRPNYNMHGTVSGRLSCSRPNMQNVPRYTEKRPVKRAFEARDGYVLLEMDYQAAELRIASHYAQERRMQAIFHQGRDPHGETAEKLGIPRFVAKTLNFLIIYGGGVNAVMKTLKCDRETAQSYLRGYHDLYPGFGALNRAMSKKVEDNGYFRMETGRVAHFNTYKRYESEMSSYKAMNRLIQGSASEMLRIGMQTLDDRIRTDGFDAYPLLQVHDSLLVEVATGQVDEFVPVLREVMTDFAFSPAPKIDVKVGNRWAPMKEYAE